MPDATVPRVIRPSTPPQGAVPLDRSSGKLPDREIRVGDRSAKVRSCAWVAADGAARRPNVLVLGASGHVAQAFLLRLSRLRSRLGRLILLDQHDVVLANPFLDHAALNYQFLRRRLNFPERAAAYDQLLRCCEVDIVLDLTDMDTFPVLAATDAAGVSYVSTSLNDAQRTVAELIAAVYPTRTRRRGAPHILSSGMNPGIVNIWVWHGFQQHGAPTGIVHFEYDTSMAVEGWRPLITWSRKEFLAEAVWEPTGLIEGGELRMFPANSLKYRESLRPIMEPVAPLASYPRGLLVLHEENVQLGAKLGTSSKYIYAVHPRTMDYLAALCRERGRVEVDDLELGDNTSIPLTGSDTIGVCLEYPDKRVYYLHSLANRDVTGTNATCAQVAVGVEAALSTLLLERLAPRIYFTSDLYDTVYRNIVFNRLPVQQRVFEKQESPLAARRSAREPRRQPRPAPEYAVA